MANAFLPLAAAPAAPPRYGLVVSSRNGGTLNETPIGNPASPSDADRWEAGYSFVPENCMAVGAADQCVPGTLTIPTNAARVDYRPIALYTADQCSPYDLKRDWQGRARRQLLAGSPTALAREFWTGALAQAQTPDYPNAYLAQTTATTLSLSALAANDALACLEEGIASTANGARGMIHATPGTVTTWQSGGALRREGGLVLTVLDTIVVADAGYDGSGPDGSAATAGNVWAYGTTMVDVRLGAPVIPQPFDTNVPGIDARTVDRSLNTVTVYAWRMAAASWDGCAHVAAKINLPLCEA